MHANCCARGIGPLLIIYMMHRESNLPILYLKFAPACVGCRSKFGYDLISGPSGFDRPRKVLG